MDDFNAETSRFINGSLITSPNQRVGLAENRLRYDARNVEQPASNPSAKSGRVTEMCKQWLVHEDSALAYQLQSQEIKQHLSHNRNRNAQIREDVPHAIDEQQREQELAEQAAAVYHRMLQEQEEVDKQVAHQLADKIEREERQKRRAIERHDEDIARKLIDTDRSRPGSSRTEFKADFGGNFFLNLPKRHAPALPLPDDLYTEPYKPESNEIVDEFDRIDIQEVGLPLDELAEFEEKRRQEEKDALLARKLQEELSNSEESILDRDRMLAIEAQDKELAKLLQERERSKAKRAKERARQKALAKKQQMEQQQQIMPDDSYSNPIDSIPRSSLPPKPAQIYLATDEETNYSYPVDLIPGKTMHNDELMFDNNEVPPPVRPTQLDLRSPLTQKINKPRYPDPPVEEENNQETVQQFNSPSKQASQGNMHNIAMAIDPTYPRRNKHSPLTYETTSSTVTTSTSNSSSPGMLLPTPDVLDEDPSPAPPYMPIQGQRRTASLEKKSKKRGKDGCKQQ